MTLEEAKNVIYANVIYACGKAGLSPSTIAIVKDACDTVIGLAEQADALQTDCDNCAESGSYKCTKCDGEMYYKADTPQMNCYITEDRSTQILDAWQVKQMQK